MLASLSDAWEDSVCSFSKNIYGIVDLLISFSSFVFYILYHVSLQDTVQLSAAHEFTAVHSTRIVGPDTEQGFCMKNSAQHDNTGEESACRSGDGLWFMASKILILSTFSYPLPIRTHKTNLSRALNLHTYRSG